MRTGYTSALFALSSVCTGHCSRAAFFAHSDALPSL